MQNQRPKSFSILECIDIVTSVERPLYEFANMTELGPNKLIKYFVVSLLIFLYLDKEINLERNI